jgi:hypothetical protein
MLLQLDLFPLVLGYASLRVIILIGVKYIPSGGIAACLPRVRSRTGVSISTIPTP